MASMIAFGSSNGGLQRYARSRLTSDDQAARVAFQPGEQETQLVDVGHRRAPSMEILAAVEVFAAQLAGRWVAGPPLRCTEASGCFQDGDERLRRHRLVTEGR